MALHTRRICTKCCACHAKGHSQDIPRVPDNLHVVITRRNLENAIRIKHAATHAWSAAHATPNQDGQVQSIVPVTLNN